MPISTLPAWTDRARLLTFTPLQRGDTTLLILVRATYEYSGTHDFRGLELEVPIASGLILIVLRYANAFFATTGTRFFVPLAVKVADALGLGHRVFLVASA